MKTILLPAVLTGLVTGQSLADDEDIMPRPPRPIREGHELVRLIRDTRVGEPYQHKNLTVYPLTSSGTASGGYWTLDRALARGLLRITEKGSGDVPELLAENLGREPVFLMAGEIVRGGKQNRVISQDMLLPPRSGPISLDVFCVEAGRWTSQSKWFEAEREVAHGKLRQQLNAPAAPSQGEVWSEVDRKSLALGAAVGDSRYLGDVFDDSSVKKDVDEYASRIRLPSSANGMAVVIGGDVVGVELFGDSQTFRALRDKLLRSYAVDALESPTRDKSSVWRGRVPEFLRRVEDARLVRKQTIGLGRLLGIEGGGVYGTVLVWSEQAGAHGVVHASMFAGHRYGDPRPLE
jgi:hypothetical protein